MLSAVITSLKSSSEVFIRWSGITINLLSDSLSLTKPCLTRSLPISASVKVKKRVHHTHRRAELPGCVKRLIAKSCASTNTPKSAVEYR
jgi:hypothetical protein